MRTILVRAHVDSLLLGRQWHSTCAVCNQSIGTLLRCLACSRVVHPLCAAFPTNKPFLCKACWNADFLSSMEAAAATEHARSELRSRLDKVSEVCIQCSTTHKHTELVLLC
eukprot:m.139777 g.139777  ORF g.139777 m.139777 type:complete len:111 (-) comp14027_c1_seq2:839-1171(-)